MYESFLKFANFDISKMKRRVVLFLCLLVYACRPGGKTDTDVVQLENLVPSTFDSLPAIPEDNQLTRARIALGKKLFFDKRLSADNSISCGSCHKKELAYADNKALSEGIHGQQNPRNTPGLVNVAYRKSLFMEGGVPNLEIQVLSPFVNTREIGFSINAAAQKIEGDTTYRRLAQAAYGSDTLHALLIAKAIASFERSLISHGSNYDAFVNGDSAALSPEAIRGKELFFSSRTDCSSCHAGFLFTDQKFYTIGIDSVSTDEARAKITLDTNDIGKFVTPGLRNVALTSPYMHDGSMAGLQEVLQHYNSGGMDNRNKDQRIRKLGLSQQEINDIIAFLKSLTDHKMPG